MQTKKQSAIIRLFACLMLATLLAGCASPKRILYFQDLDNDVLLNPIKYTEPKIQKGDILSIIVSAPDKEVIQPYNFSITEVGSGYSDYQRSIVNYQVNSSGEINFPILGKIKAAGMTSVELEKYLTLMIGADVKDPIVSVSFVNFRITVLGEVRTPGTFTVTSERINILQALGLAGDLLITAKREDIILLRNIDGRQAHIKIDLTSKEILQAPYFYLQQNDVLYVPPSVSRVIQGQSATGLWTAVIATISAVATVIAVITR